MLTQLEGIYDFSPLTDRYVYASDALSPLWILSRANEITERFVKSVMERPCHTKEIRHQCKKSCGQLDRCENWE
jgi:hypothetical protein